MPAWESEQWSGGVWSAPTREQLSWARRLKGGATNKPQIDALCLLSPWARATAAPVLDFHGDPFSLGCLHTNSPFPEIASVKMTLQPKQVLAEDVSQVGVTESDFATGKKPHFVEF